MKKLITVVLIGAVLGTCTKEKPAPKRMQASDLATPHIHHGTQSDFVRQDYILGDYELPAGINYSHGVMSGSLEHELNVVHITGHRSGMNVPFFRGAKRAITLSIAGFEGEEVKVKGVFNAWNSDATFLKWNGNAWEAPLVLGTMNRRPELWSKMRKRSFHPNLGFLADCLGEDHHFMFITQL